MVPVLLPCNASTDYSTTNSPWDGDTKQIHIVSLNYVGHSKPAQTVVVDI